MARVLATEQGDNRARHLPFVPREKTPPAWAGLLSTSAAVTAHGAGGINGENTEGSSHTAEDNSEEVEDDFDDPRVAILDAALEHVHEHG